MTQINLAGLQASSLFPGLQEHPSSPVTTSGSIASVAVAGSGSAADGTLSIAMPKNNLLTLNKVNLTGMSAGVSNYWFPFMVSTLIRDGNFGIYIISKNDAGGRKLVFDIQNFTGGALTFGGCGITVISHLYEYPWA